MFYVLSVVLKIRWKSLYRQNSPWIMVKFDILSHSVEVLVEKETDFYSYSYSILSLAVDLFKSIFCWRKTKYGKSTKRSKVKLLFKSIYSFTNRFLYYIVLRLTTVLRISWCGQRYRKVSFREKSISWLCSTITATFNA